jgi:hypothetical protein
MFLVGIEFDSLKIFVATKCCKCIYGSWNICINIWTACLFLIQIDNPQMDSRSGNGRDAGRGHPSHDEEPLMSKGWWTCCWSGGHDHVHSLGRNTHMDLLQACLTPRWASILLPLCVAMCVGSCLTGILVIQMVWMRHVCLKTGLQNCVSLQVHRFTLLLPSLMEWPSKK